MKTAAAILKQLVTRLWHEFMLTTPLLGVATNQFHWCPKIQRGYEWHWHCRPVVSNICFNTGLKIRKGGLHCSSGDSKSFIQMPVWNWDFHKACMLVWMDPEKYWLAAMHSTQKAGWENAQLMIHLLAHLFHPLTIVFFYPKQCKRNKELNCTRVSDFSFRGLAMPS